MVCTVSSACVCLPAWLPASKSGRSPFACRRVKATEIQSFTVYFIRAKLTDQ